MVNAFCWTFEKPNTGIKSLVEKRHKKGRTGWSALISSQQSAPEHCPGTCATTV